MKLLTYKADDLSDQSPTGFWPTGQMAYKTNDLLTLDLLTLDLETFDLWRLI